MATTKSDALQQVLTLTNTLAQVAISVQQAQKVLDEAHTEKWAEDDPRWEKVFADARAARMQALSKL